MCNFLSTATNSVSENNSSIQSCLDSIIITRVRPHLLLTTLSLLYGGSHVVFCVVVK